MWISVLVIIVIILVAWWYMNRGQGVVETIGDTPAPETTPTVTPVPSPSPSSSPATSAMTVSMTDTGFSPATITVPAGTTVTFVNNGQAAHRPASNPHPTHTDLPGFDATRALQTGESYSFTFTKVGTWGYHDHPNPSTKGQVVVQ